MPKCVLFANDIVLVEKSRKDVDYKLEVWKEVLKSKTFRLRWSKTKYMECKFSKRQTNNDLEIKIGVYIIPQVSRS